MFFDVKGSKTWEGLGYMSLSLVLYASSHWVSSRSDNGLFVTGSKLSSNAVVYKLMTV